MCSIDMWFSDSSSNESSDEVDLLEALRERRRIRDNTNPLEMDSKEFITNFRLSKEVFIDLLTEIDDKLQKGKRRTSIPNILKLAVTLKFCAQNFHQIRVGKEGSFGLAQPTVSGVLADVFNALEQTICPQYINFQYTESDIEEAKSFFKKETGIPGVIGCIDTFHIKIIAPEKKLQPLYHNRKGYYSIQAMIVCDHKMVIRFINAKNFGSLPYSTIFEQSNLKTLMENRYENEDQKSWWLGNSTYDLQPYLITPYRNPKKSSPQSYYNKMHAKAMNTMKTTIKILKARFKCLKGEKPLYYTPEKSAQIFNVCVALHNICCAFNLQLPEDDLDGDSDEGNTDDDDEEKSDVKDDITAETMTRREIVKSLSLPFLFQ